MKRLVLAIAALAAVAAPLATATSAEAQSRNDRREYRDDRSDARRDYRDDRRDDRRYDRQDNRRDDRRDDRRYYNNNNNYNQRWDDRRYNGYYLGNRWYYGAPQASYYNRYDYRPDYRAWQRGGYLPPAYRGYVVNDYGRYRLRQPPRGYHWVRANDDYVLAAIATGLILEVIGGNY